MLPDDGNGETPVEPGGGLLFDAEPAIRPIVLHNIQDMPRRRERDYAPISSATMSG